MGVPAFFRWLTRKYPSVIVNCIEVTPKDVNGRIQEVDPSEPNPNGIEFDNLYLDMNGIIHPCTHPEDKPAPKDEDEMMVAIFEAIDRLLNIVRPRKLLYMAIDGVAPRAKMNQQRSRRFRASKEAAEKSAEITRVRAKLEAEGAILPPPKDSSHFDSNCITPGTPFMDRLSKCLHYYAHDRLNNHPAWKNLKIILSDANVPGEGEHKVMDFIRKQRGQPDYNPNTVHCLCGADADLMMLGLATHEPHFYIIREEFKPNMDRPCDICGLTGHELKDCSGLEKNEQVVKIFSPEVQFIFVRLSVLREYLRRELDMPGLPFPYDFERAVDDWVFMCFFVGNDFLPHLPSLEIREGAIDRLVNLYKKAVYRTGGFLTENGQVQLSRVQLIMNELGIVEDEIFKKRQQTEEMFRARDKAKRKRIRLQQSREHRPTHILSGQYAPTALGGTVAPLMNPRQEAFQQRMQNMHTSANATATATATANESDSQKGVKRSRSEYSSDEEDPHTNDEVRLWESGFKDRYYESKFDVMPGNEAFRRKVALEYAKGLCWVLHYYFQGCPSWNWYFPYHYAPFASDFFNISGEAVVWEKGTGPFRPLEQLMSVFPAASRQHVPEPWGRLMTDPFSPIIDFYPEDFKIDLNGKKFAWQGVALLPFVDEKRLHKALDPLYAELTDEEARRNCRGDDRMFVAESNTSFPFVKGLYENDRNYDCEIAFQSDGVCGRVLLASDVVNCGGSLPAPIRGLEVVRGNKVLCVRFRDAKYSEGHIYPSKRLPAAADPPSILKPQNLADEVHRNWKPQIGMVPATQVASLGTPGHRMLGHYANVGRNAPGQYSAVAPPSANSYGGGRDYGYRARNSFHNSNSYQPYKDRRSGYESRQQNYHSNSDNRHHSDRHQSTFSQQRGAVKESSVDRYAPRSEGYSTTNRVENSARLPPPGYAVSYTVNADHSSGQRPTRPPYQSGNQGYQQYNPNSRSGGPRPAGFYRNHDQRYQPRQRDDARSNR